MNKLIKKLECGDFEVIDEIGDNTKIKREVCIAQKLQEQRTSFCEIKDLALDYYYLEEDNNICVCEFSDGSRAVLDNGEIMAVEVKF